MTEDENSEISKKKVQKDVYDANEMQFQLSRQLFYCNDLKVGFDKDRNIGDGICDMKKFKQNTREKNWRYQQKPLEDEQKLLKNCG